MEQKLQQVQDYFANQQFEEKIDKILEEYLDNSKCDFTTYQKNVLPICAAYYAIIEVRVKELETEKKEFQTPTTQQDKDTQKQDENTQTIKNIEDGLNKQKGNIKDESQSTSSSCASPSDKNYKQNSEQKNIKNVSLIQLRNLFYKLVPIDQLLKTMTEFSSILCGRPFADIIQSKLESVKRNYSLFIKFSNVLEFFYGDNEQIQKQLMQKVIWRLYLLLKEQFHQEHNEEDIEKCAYLLHFICNEALVSSGKTTKNIANPQQNIQNVLTNTSSQPSSNQISSMSTVSDQVNAILLKSKLETSIMKEFKQEFRSALYSLSEQLFDSKYSKKQQRDSYTNSINQETQIINENQSQNLAQQTDMNKNGSQVSDDKERMRIEDTYCDEEKESDNVSTASKEKSNEGSPSSLSPKSIQSQIVNSFSNNSALEKLNKLLENEMNKDPTIEENEFIQKEEQLKQSLITPKAKPISSMIAGQNPPGITQDHLESKQQNNLLNYAQQIPKKTLNFNDDAVGIHFNAKLSDFERPIPSPLLNNGIHGNQLGLFQQPHTPKTPYDHQFKIPNIRNPQMQAMVPSTPVSTALDNCKWFNVYSKSDPTIRIDQLMYKIGKEYKQKIIQEVQSIAREIFHNSKKKNEGLSNSDNTIENKVTKISYFFYNVLEKMIQDEESRNCKETVLIDLLKNRDFIFSLLANCVMTMCYIREIKGITLDFVCQQCKITSLDYWRVISNFAKFDKFMPEVIREQLFNQEKLILLYNIWEEKDKQMQNALKSFAEDNGRNQSYEKVICRRLISHSATRVKEICKVIELNEDIQERVWDALLYVYRAQIQLMNGRYVDQIIICSIYALKLIKSDLFKEKEIKFKGMITKCENLLHFNSEKVKKTQNDNGETIDIINFYNKIYLTPMKAYFKSTNDIGEGQGQAPLTPNSLILNSSLKNSIPQTFINYTPLIKEEMLPMQMNRANMTPITPMTPMTQQLQAVRENLQSPYLINPELQFLKNKIANLHKSTLKGGLVNTSNGNSINSQQKNENGKQNTVTVAVLGQSYSSNSQEIFNQNAEKKFSRDEKTNASNGTTINFFGNIQSVVVGTPTLEQKQSSSSLGTSPKFGQVNSGQYNSINRKKSSEIGIEDQQNRGSFQQRTLQRQNSIFGVKNPDFNSDDENMPNKKTNPNVEGATKSSSKDVN